MRSCHDELAVAGICVAFSPNIFDVSRSYLVECVCFQPVWCRSVSTCIRLGDVSVPSKAYAQQGCEVAMTVEYVLQCELAMGNS